VTLCHLAFEALWIWGGRGFGGDGHRKPWWYFLSILAREERGGRLPRRLAVSARLVGGGSWRRTATLREPTAESERLRQSLAPKLKELPAPAVELRLELGELTESVGTQAELVRPRGSRLRGRLREGLRQVRVAMGMEAICTVVEVAPWSRIPEARAILVPRDD